MSVVLDACVVAALIVDDPRQPAVQTTLDGWLRAGQELHAPSVLPYEVANVLARRVFDGDLDPAEVPDLWGDVADLDLVLHPFDLVRDGPEIAKVTRTLRRRHATDSAYVSLALRLGTRAWTLDGPLFRGARDVGLPVDLIS